MTIAEEKQAQRTAGRAARKALDAPQRAAANAALCRRVGMGKGYYDRYLPYCTRAVKIGIAFEAQRVEHAAVDEHDQRLDAYVTERGIYTWK